jgi:hypothetical protein
MALFSNLILNIPINLIILFVPLLYVLNIRSFHRFCENYVEQRVTEQIKSLTPVPSDLTVRAIVMSYSFLFTMLLAELAFSCFVMILFWLF